METSNTDWPMRSWILALVLALCGLGVHLSLDDGSGYATSETPPRLAAAALFFFGGLAFGFSLEKLRWQWAVVFAVVAGATISAISYWVAGYGGGVADFDWPFGSGLVALVLATPLFQTARDAGAWRFAYDRLHFHAWTDVVIYIAALAFTGVSWLLILLLSELFKLIGITVIVDLINMGWFAWMFSGGVFGAALGILRDNEKILGTLQRVVLIILSVLAPPLAVALVIFLLSLLFTGLDTLWDATDAATPILICCAVGAVVLANSVIRDSEADASGSRVLRWSAMVLALTILPLASIAAVSMGLRLGQYGMTPERIWGLLAVAIAVAYGLVYLVSVVRGRMLWADFVRPANTKLAIALCGIALFLALPIMDFGAISARDQLARLESGKVSPKEFDYFAMAHEFGPVGKEIAVQLVKSGDPVISKNAAKAVSADSRYEMPMPAETDAALAKARANLRLFPDGGEPGEGLLAAVAQSNRCEFGPCVAYRIADRRYVVAGKPYAQSEVTTCMLGLGGPDGKGQFNCQDFYAPPDPDYTRTTRSEQPVKQLSRDSRIEWRTVQRRQLFVDGKPVGGLVE